MSFVPDPEEVDAAVLRGDVQWLKDAFETANEERTSLMHELSRMRHDPKAQAAHLPPIPVLLRYADGSTVERRIVPEHTWYGIPGGNPLEWQGECQWALYAWDVDRKEYVHLLLKCMLMTPDR
jgi:hypothetical protein